MQGISDGVTPATPLRGSSGVSGRALLAAVILYVLLYLTSRGLTERWEAATSLRVGAIIYFGSFAYSWRRYR